MAETLRFPLVASGPAGPHELDQIIVLAQDVLQLEQGGPPVMTPITPWHRDVFTTEAPYCEIVIEFLSGAAQTIGDGTVDEMIGLYGEIDQGPGAGRFLLGVLGLTLGGAKPQIPIFSATVGYAQVVQLVAVYDRLGVGGINDTIGFDQGTTIRARPIRKRIYVG